MKFLKYILNLVGATGLRLKYGCENLQHAVVSVTMQASQTIATAAGSMFVTLDTSGNAALTTASNNTIFGHLISASYGDVTSSTAGASLYSCNVGLDAIYRVPILAADQASTGYTRAYRGLSCDLKVTSNQQTVLPRTDTKHHLMLLDGDEINSYWVIAKINQAVQKGQA